MVAQCSPVAGQSALELVTGTVFGNSIDKCFNYFSFSKFSLISNINCYTYHQNLVSEQEVTDLLLCDIIIPKLLKLLYG